MEIKAFDGKDQKIIDLLITDARTSLSDLSAHVGLSAPTIAERIRRLERTGVIRAFTVDLDPKALGYPLEALVRIRPMPGQVAFVEKLITQTPQIIECDKVTGDDCFVARMSVASMEEIDAILERISEKASTSTSLIKRTPLKRRPPPLDGQRAGQRAMA